MRAYRPVTTAMIIAIALTAIVWILRGFGILSFLPGGILWLLIFATAGLVTFKLLRWSE